MAMTLSLDEFDPRHLRAVTPAVAGLEDARVAAGPRGELRPDLLEQLVGGLALLHVAPREPARVQRAALGLRHELLDDRTDLHGPGPGSHDPPRPDQRRGEVTHQGQLPHAPAAKRAARFPVTHGFKTPSPFRRPRSRRL